MNLSVLLRILAFVLFVIAALIGLGDATVAHSGALVPGGLALWVLSTLVA